MDKNISSIKSDNVIENYELDEVTYERIFKGLKGIRTNPKNIELLKNAFIQGLGFQKNDSVTEQVIHLRKQFEAGKELALGSSSNEAIIAKSPLFPNVDGIKFLTHESGCGENKDDSENLCALLAGYCVNPNVGGITILSLGCQHSQIAVFKQKLAEKDPSLINPEEIDNSG